jgi:hypothetical protein
MLLDIQPDPAPLTEPWLLLVAATAALLLVVAFVRRRRNPR